MDMWNVVTMSFRGTVPGAVHIYGVLIGPHGRKYKICQLLDKAGAAEMNEHAERMGKTWLTYEVDEPNEFFMRDEDLRECARVAFLYLAAPDSVLAIGGLDPGLNPSEILAGPEDAMEALNAIWAYDQSETSMQWTDVRRDAGKRWAEALEGLGIEHESDYEDHAPFRVIVDRYPTIIEERSPCGYRASVTLETT